MRVLVVYASKHGATRGIAERIAERIGSRAADVELRSVEDAGDLAGYDAFVLGSAAYLGHWMKEATDFVRRHRELLGERPVWLFSSGPLGTDEVDDEGQDLRVASAPAEFAEFEESLQPLGMRVFFGALNPRALGFRDRLIRRLPAGRSLLPEGDFRRWPEIEAWADEIASRLSPARADAR